MEKQIRWSQRQEGNFAIIEMRIPTIDMPKAEYEGKEASNRIQRFAIGLLAGLRAGGSTDPLISSLLAHFDDN